MVTDFKKRNFHIIQLCEVQDSTIKELVAHVKKENAKNYHQTCDERFGWIDRKTNTYIIKRLKEVMRRTKVQQMASV